MPEIDRRDATALRLVLDVVIAEVLVPPFLDHLVDLRQHLRAGRRVLHRLAAFAAGNETPRL